MAEDIYKDSWQLYKAHTESFVSLRLVCATF